PFWFQHQQLHSELVGVLLQLSRGLRHEREARVATERRLSELTGDVALAAREIGRVETASSRGPPEPARQASSEVHQLTAQPHKRVDQQAAGLGARLDTLSQTATDIGARVAALTRSATEMTASIASLGTNDGLIEQRLAALEPDLATL